MAESGTIRNPLRALRTMWSWAAPRRRRLVALFVTAMPGLPALVLLANRLELFVDLTKLLYCQRRPWPRSVDSIGAWLRVFQTITCTAVVTNAAVVFFVIRWADTGAVRRAWGFFIFQYCVFATMLALELVVPDVPAHISLQLQRQAFVTSKIIDFLPDDDYDDDAALLVEAIIAGLDS